MWLTIKGSLQSRATCIYSYGLSKCLDDAHTFLVYVLLTKSSFHIIFPPKCPHGIVSIKKVLKFKISFQDLEKVLNLAKMYMKH